MKTRDERPLSGRNPMIPSNTQTLTKSASVDSNSSLRPPIRMASSVPTNQASAREHVEWSLLVGAKVEIRCKGRVLRTGFVEHAMPDSSALWIAADATGPRQIYEVCQGHQVWVTPQELPGEVHYRMTVNQILGEPPRGVPPQLP